MEIEHHSKTYALTQLLRQIFQPACECRMGSSPTAHYFLSWLQEECHTHPAQNSCRLALGELWSELRLWFFDCSFPRIRKECLPDIYTGSQPCIFWKLILVNRRSITEKQVQGRAGHNSEMVPWVLPDAWCKHFACMFGILHSIREYLPYLFQDSKVSTSKVFNSILR